MNGLVLPDTIFLAAKMGVGKDWVAAQLVERAGFTRLAFADALKVEVAEHLGISLEELAARKAEFRPLLQNWGVDRREQNPNYWVERWAAARAAIPGPVVNTDTRFPNEGFYALRSGALLVRLVVPDEIRIKRLTARDGRFDPAWLEHPSEQHIDSLPWQLTIDCSETPGDYPTLISAGYVGLLAAKHGQRRAA